MAARHKDRNQRKQNRYKLPTDERISSIEELRGKNETRGKMELVYTADKSYSNVEAVDEGFRK
jgi:hypothetical protein